MLLQGDISVALDTNPCLSIITKGAQQSIYLFSTSFHLTCQVHRIWRVQRELLRDEFRLDTLRPLQEQSVLAGCSASCESSPSHSYFTFPFFPVFVSLSSTAPTYLRGRSLSSLLFSELLNGLPKQGPC